MTLPDQPKRAVTVAVDSTRAAIVAAPLPPSPAALGVPLLAQVDFDLLILTISGHLSSALRWPPKQVAVVAAWLSHLNENDDDVWPGAETLAAKAKVGESTVKRAKRELRKLIGLFPVSNPESRPRNQSQHKGDRRGKLPTDHYELTPLAKLLPRGIWLKLVAAYKADKTRRAAARAAVAASSPRSHAGVGEAAAQDIQPADARTARVDETGLPNPLDDAAPISTHDLPPTAQGGNPALSGPPVHATAGASPALCNVEIEIEAKKESEGRPADASKNRKKPLAATATETFRGPILAPIREDGSRLPGYEAVRAFSPPMSRNRYEAIIKAFDDAWAEKVAWYVKWLPNCKPKNYAKTAVAVFNRWIEQPGQHGWPTEFEVWLTRHQNDVQQRAERAAHARNAARVRVTEAPERAETTPEVIPTAVLLRALEIERGRGRKLHERAKLTIESPPVVTRAKILLHQERNEN